MEINPPIHESAGKQTRTDTQGYRTAHSSTFYEMSVNIHEQDLFEHTTYWSISLPSAAAKASVKKIFSQQRILADTVSSSAQ